MIRSYFKETVPGSDTLTPSCHASTVLPLDDGSVLVAWFGGTHEKADDVNIYIALRSPSGSWSPPRRVSADDGVANWNPVLCEKQNGGILLFYKYGREIPDWITMVCESSDGGKRWTAPRELVPGDVSGGRGPVKNKCLRLPDGTLLAPASTEQHGRWLPFIDVSKDDGETWAACEKMERAKYRGAFVGLIQPTLWRSQDGQIHALMRSNKGALYRSDSSDNGAHWSKPRRTHIPNNNSGIDAAADDEGRVWLLYNPVAENWGDRWPLSLAVSTDNGKHFTEILRPEPGKGEFSYPAVVIKNKKLYATYTNQRKKISFFVLEPEN